MRPRGVLAVLLCPLMPSQPQVPLNFWRVHHSSPCSNDKTWKHEVPVVLLKWPRLPSSPSLQPQKRSKRLPQNIRQRSTKIWSPHVSPNISVKRNLENKSKRQLGHYYKQLAKIRPTKTYVETHGSILKNKLGPEIVLHHKGGQPRQSGTYHFREAAFS